LPGQPEALPGLEGITFLFPSLTVNQKAGSDELQDEIERGHFVRAAILAASVGLPEEEIQNLRYKALWQVSAAYRNAKATKRLAQDYVISKKELGEFLEKQAEETRRQGNSKALESCYDLSTGRYLSFEEWKDHFLRNWDKLTVS
jgi:hypothetical protein